MSTLEKFGILVILILVVIIGVVAVWGVRPDEANPFDETAGDGATTPAVEDPTAQAANWPTGGTGPAAVSDSGAGPVAPPVIGSVPTPPAAGGSTPAAPSGGSTYVVKQGDTLEKIAKETLGDGNRWQEIVKANPGLSPKRLKIKQEIKIPGGGGGTSVAIAPTAPVHTPTRSFVETPVNVADGPSDGVVATAPAMMREVEVRSGDTLYGIAQRELGNSNLYYKIQQANPGLDPKKLKPGMKIKLPL